jgi:formylglycine-generating enzyme required for sulfatase activity
MHGNVWEWCADLIESEMPAGMFLGRGPVRVLRGGGWDSLGDDCEASYKKWTEQSSWNFKDGFRLAAVSSGEPVKNK